MRGVVDPIYVELELPASVYAQLVALSTLVGRDVNVLIGGALAVGLRKKLARARSGNPRVAVARRASSTKKAQKAEALRKFQDALEAMWDEAERTDLSKITQAEINAEIRAVRAGRSKRRRGR